MRLCWRYSWYERRVLTPRRGSLRHGLKASQDDENGKRRTAVTQTWNSLYQALVRTR